MKKSKSKVTKAKRTVKSVSAKNLLSKWVLASIASGDFTGGKNTHLIADSLEYVLNDSLDNINAAYSLEELEKMLHQKT